MGNPGLAIFAGRGILPKLIAEDCAARGAVYTVVTFEGMSLDWSREHPSIVAVFEKPGKLFADLRKASCTQVTFAGGLERPDLNPLRFDRTMIRLAPKVIAGMRFGDDSLLRLVTSIFEAEGFELRAPDELMAGLIVEPGAMSARSPGQEDIADIERAADIVFALGPVDVGQGCVVAQGLCLGIETIQGTDAMLSFVGSTAASARPNPNGARGVLYKAPKPDQERRIDLPSFGPDTIRALADAGLGGLAVQAGGALVLGRGETQAVADELGIFIWGCEKRNWARR